MPVASVKMPLFGSDSCSIFTNAASRAVSRSFIDAPYVSQHSGVTTSATGTFLTHPLQARRRPRGGYAVESNMNGLPITPRAAPKDAQTVQMRGAPKSELEAAGAFAL